MRGKRTRRAPVPESSTGGGRESLRLVSSSRGKPWTTRAALRFLAESAHDLNASLDLEEVFQKIARRVYELVDCHLFCILLWNEETGLLEHSYSLKFGEHLEVSGSFPLGYGISGTAGALRRPLRVGDVRKDRRYVRFRHAEVDIRSELAVPLVVQDRLVGVLDLESMEPELFTEEDEEMLLALASHIATALENARLYDRVRRQEQRMERDLDTARMIQRGLLADEIPRVDGLEIGRAFAPARELAGDFYDFLPYGDGRLAVAVGDVAGKATGAALYGSMAMGVMRGHVVQHACSPEEILSHLNAHLAPLDVDYRFLAMVYGVFDVPRRELVVASAGFPWPRLIRGGEVTRLEAPGLPLGLFPEAEYRQLRVALRPGDVVVFCSDGLEDCLDDQLDPSKGTRLDAWLERLARCPAPRIAEELMLASEPSFMGRLEAADDRTVVALRLLPEAPSLA